MFRIIVNDSQLQAAFARLRSRTNDQSAAMSNIGEYMSRRVDDGFRKEQDFYGSPWAKLSDRTIKQKQKKRQIQKILQSSGLLRGTFSYTASTNSVEIGTNRVSASGAPLGLLHQLGSRKNNLPARPMLPDPDRLPPQDLEEVLAIIGDHVESAW